MNTKAFIKTCLLVAGLGISIGARADDVPTPSTPATPAASEKKPEQHIMMDHSKADPKAMSRMKDKTVPIHKSGDCTPTSPTPSVTPP